MDITNNYFDADHPLRPYTFSLPAMPGTLPPLDALRNDLPPEEPGRWWGEKHGDWIYIEDHRGEEGYLNGEAHTIKDFGPRPAGWSATPPPPPPPSPEEQQAAFTSAIQTHLDTFAQTRNYDGIMSAATYATSTVPKFRTEGQYAVEARDLTWAKAYAIMDAVMSGARPLPSLAEVLAELPPLAWPG